MRWKTWKHRSKFRHKIIQWLIIPMAAVFFTGGVLTPAALAQDPAAETEEKTEVEAVEVWGTRISSSSFSLGEDQIAIKQADHLSDLLRDVPGVDVGGTHSLNQRINIRGLSGTKLDVRLDGAPQDVYLFHHFGDLRINADILREADIQVGANSIVNNGLGGGVRFKTMSADDLLAPGRNIGARLRTGFSTNSANAYSVAGFGRAGIFDFLGYGTYLDQKTGEDGAGNDLNEGDGEVVNLLAKAGISLGDTQRLELILDKFTDEGDYPARPNFGRQWSELIGRESVFPTEYNRESVSLGYELAIGASTDIEASLYHTRNNISRWEGVVNGVPWFGIRSDADIDGEGVNQGLTLMAQTSVDTMGIGHRFTYGFEYQNQTSEQTVTPRPTSATAVYARSEEERLLQTVYLEDRISYKRVAIIPGIRYNHYDREFHQQPEQSWSEVTYALGGEVEVTDELTLKADYTQLFKGPNLTEIFATTIHNTTHNPDLEAETGDNKELGFIFQTARIPWLDELVVKGSVFRTDIDNYIDDLSDNNSNMGQVDIEGFELSLAMFKDGFDAQVSYSRSNSNMDLYGPVTGLVDGDPLPEDVGDSIGVHLGYTYAPWDLRVEWNSQFVLKNDRYKEDSADKEAYDVHGVSFHWQPRMLAGFSLILGVENLFDTLYYSHASETGLMMNTDATDYEPGRNVKLSLAYTF